MIWTDIPPLAEVTEANPAVAFYTDEDGGYWVPVDLEPHQHKAWLRAEATAGVALIPDEPSRITAPVSDCELGHYCRDDYSCDAHPECPATPCPPSEATDCWAFINVADSDEFRAGLCYSWVSR